MNPRASLPVPRISGRASLPQKTSAGVREVPVNRRAPLLGDQHGPLLAKQGHEVADELIGDVLAYPDRGRLAVGYVTEHRAASRQTNFPRVIEGVGTTGRPHARGIVCAPRSPRMHCPWPSFSSWQASQSGFTGSAAPATPACSSVDGSARPALRPNRRRHPSTAAPAAPRRRRRAGAARPRCGC